MDIPNSSQPVEELLPPYNFTANILGPSQVKLEWKTPPRPSTDSTESQFFYIINVRQISANGRGGRKFAPLQASLGISCVFAS